MPSDCIYCGTGDDELRLDSSCKHGYCLHINCGIRGIVCLECIVFTNEDSDIDTQYELNDFVSYLGEYYTYEESIYLFAFKLRLKEIYGTDEKQIVKMIKELYTHITYQGNTRDKIRDIFIMGYKKMQTPFSINII